MKSCKDYAANITVTYTGPSTDEFIQGQSYECFSITKSGNAKVIDEQRDENYLLKGEFRIEGWVRND